MTDLHADVAIIGSGFGGTLAALLLERVGLRPVLIDRAGHPRIVLGESSTPLADMLLRALAQKYGLPRIEPLAEYGSWQRAYPELTCGLKRGFSYFQHVPGQPFAPDPQHTNELLVEASFTDDDADTHWYRPEFDLFLVREAERAGIPFFDRTQIDSLTQGENWTLHCRRESDTIQVTADFLIDASGDGGFLMRHLGEPVTADRMRTRSRALWGHFTGVRPWQGLLAAGGGNVADHPFPCDDAALHHVVDGGWMYVLRFNNSVTSAGFLIDCERHPLDNDLPVETEWQQWLERYPSIGEQFREARLTPLCGNLRRTPRLQRRAARTVGPRWALLPQAAYTLDALHSSGNAHTLYGIERLVDSLQHPSGSAARQEALQQHDRLLQSEIDLVDQIVHGCYRGFANFELFTSMAMFYFAGAHNSEDLRRRDVAGPGHAFLLADRPDFRSAVDRCYTRLLEITTHQATAAEVRDFGELVKRAIEPFNIAGLCDDSRHNMYPFLIPPPPETVAGHAAISQSADAPGTR